MAGNPKTIPNLPAASALTGVEPFETVQSSASVQATASQLATYVMSLITGVSPGNPTAVAGPSAHNGSAPTFMRSDGSPAVQVASNAQLGLVQGDGSTFTVDGSGVGHAASSTITPVTSTSSTSYTAVLGDAGGYKRFTSGSAVTWTIPPNASVAFPLGTTLAGKQAGAGVVHVVGGAGVTINSRGSLFHSNGQNAVFQLIQDDAIDTWTLYGDLVT